MIVDYGFCDQTVTVYRLTETGVARQVLYGCFYRYEDTLTTTDSGEKFTRKCLIIQPGESQQLFPGDRVMPGIGPETVNWATFLPAAVPGLSQIAYATPWYWEGKHCHTEAGRK